MNPIKEIAKEVAEASSRRSFLRRAGLVGIAGALAPAASTLFAPSEAAAATPTPSPELDAAILNFALNLEYLEANFYLYAVNGSGVATADTVGGDGTAGGSVLVKDSSTIVPFSSDVVKSYALEIAADEEAHVKFLRSALAAAGDLQVAQPDLDLFNSFNALGKAIGLPGGTFDPFASDLDFLLGAFIFEDVGVTAYHGAAPLIFTKAYLKAAAGILAVEAYHASEVRTVLFGMAQQMEDPTTITDIVQKISDARDTGDTLRAKDKDQGIVDSDNNANIVPTDSNSLAFARTTTQVLRIVYGAGGDRVPAPGLFFPSGMNGAIK